MTDFADLIPIKSLIKDKLFDSRLVIRLFNSR